MFFFVHIFEIFYHFLLWPLRTGACNSLASELLESVEMYK